LKASAQDRFGVGGVFATVDIGLAIEIVESLFVIVDTHEFRVPTGGMPLIGKAVQDGGFGADFGAVGGEQSGCEVKDRGSIDAIAGMAMGSEGLVEDAALDLGVVGRHGLGSCEETPDCAWGEEDIGVEGECPLGLGFGAETVGLAQGCLERGGGDDVDEGGMHLFGDKGMAEVGGPFPGTPDDDDQVGIGGHEGCGLGWDRAMCRARRMARATMVKVGLALPAVGKTEEPAMKRLGLS
jgi:hypothetical protein